MTSGSVELGVFSVAHDLHAHAVVTEVRSLGHNAHLVATDALAEHGSLSWWGPPARAATISTFDGDEVDLAALDAAWWRRVNQPQAGLSDRAAPEHLDLISNEWRSALAGAAFDAFSGTWVNDPQRDIVAGNKLVQLRAARRVGFDVPKTLVSSDADDVVAFCGDMGGTVVAKKLVGAPPKPLVTVPVSLAELEESRASIGACPTMYQEVVAGTRHLRVNCFGSSIHAFSIDSEHLDWRRDLTSPMQPVTLEREVEERFRAVVRELGLRMAVMDAKRREDGSLVWIELNPQGQFLFCEGLTGYPLTRRFAEFLIETAGAERLASKERAAGGSQASGGS
jgi:hypothetical protein